MNISGTLAIGNGEKCPYCELLIEENLYGNTPKAEF